MKQLIQFSLASSLFFGSSVFALNPIQGFYGGIMAEVSHGLIDNSNFSNQSNSLFRNPELLTCWRRWRRFYWL